MAEDFLSTVAQAVYFNKDNAEFISKDGFITMKTAQNAEQRVILHRLFPYDAADEYISVLDTDQNELGLILSLDDFEGASREALCGELARKYYVQKIKAILGIKDRHGFTHWTVETADGKEEFTLHDTYRSFFNVDGDRLVITDVDGNRYVIESLKALDGKSYKRIELYL